MKNERDRTPTPLEIPLPQPAPYQAYSRELTPVSVPIAMEKSEGVNVKRIHVSLPMMITVLLFIVGVAVAVTSIWFKMESHLGSREAHVDMQEAMRGGGVAYKNDVENAKTDIDRKIRRALKSGKVTCKKEPGRDTLSCEISLPID